jgi:hypothetical protein
VQEMVQNVDQWIELVLEGATEPLGRWKWAPAIPRPGETIEHEGRDLEVSGITWSTTDPRTARLAVRATSG